MSNLTRYAEDPTGSNPDNLVAGEVHTLSDRPIRVVVPKFAPFFNEDSLVLFDNMTQRRLVKNTDYRIPVISREATLRYGKEVGDAILIENSEVSSQVLITYQCIGGDLQKNFDNIATIYESFLNDNRLVDWVTGILGKPSTFPPSEHAHWLSEVFGFEPLAFELERLAQAVQLGNAPAFEAIIQSLKDNITSFEDIDKGVPVEKYVTLDKLIYALTRFNFNSMTLTPNGGTIGNGGSLWLDVTASNMPDNTVLYWTIEHYGTASTDFEANSGLFTLMNGKGRFMIQAKMDQEAEEDEPFRLCIRKNSITGHVLITSNEMTLSAHEAYYETHILEGVRVEDMNSPRLTITAVTYGANQGEWNNGAFN